MRISRMYSKMAKGILVTFSLLYYLFQLTSKEPFLFQHLNFLLIALFLPNSEHGAQ